MIFRFHHWFIVMVLVRSVSFYALPMPIDLANYDVQKTPGYTDYGAASSWSAISSHKKIFFYQKSKPYYEFTNFYEAPFMLDSTIWPTSEHYYQAMKFTDAGLQNQISRAPTARAAFNLAHTYSNQVRADWSRVNLQTMKRAVWEKFWQSSRLMMSLISTGAAVLIEDAKAHDAFYGAGADYKGYNYLGRILMLERTCFQRNIILYATQGTVAVQPAPPISQPKKTIWQRLSKWISSFFARQ